MKHAEPTGIIRTALYRSPAGELLTGEYDGCIVICDWTANAGRHDRILSECAARFNARIAEAPSELISELHRELDEYFAGSRRQFSVPVKLYGTAFRLSVLNELSNVVYGSTATYAEIAQRVGKPGAVRAVASAIGGNPVSILLPCHRIIGSDNSLRGYAGGLEAKRLLLELESEHHFVNLKGV